MKKRFILCFTVLFTSIFALFAMPGFESYLPDQAGEFIYYKDNTFDRTSYIGILSYDDKTFQLRYYAPKNGDLPEKTVATLVTLDYLGGHIDLTGERIISADYDSQDDVDIINYLHDLVYNFGSKRCLLSSLTPKTKQYTSFVGIKEDGLKVSSNLEQFGGDIVIVYDCLIPFFNIKRIETSKGKVLFECVELGKISSAQDTLFNTYKEFPPKKNIKANSVKQKKSKKVNFTVKNQQIEIDDSWEKKLDFMYVQNEDAILTFTTYQSPENNSDPYFVQYFLLRNFLESKDNTLIDFNSSKVDFTVNGFNLYSDTYAIEPSKVYTTIKYITLNSDGNYDFMSFAATRAAYQMKRSYYDKILKTYKN